MEKIGFYVHDYDYPNRPIYWRNYIKNINSHAIVASAKFDRILLEEYQATMERVGYRSWFVEFADDAAMIYFIMKWS
jgi:hypothetical protein